MGAESDGRVGAAIVCLVIALALGCSSTNDENEETGDAGIGRPIACGRTEDVSPIVAGSRKACSLPGCRCDGAFRILGPDPEELGTFAAAEIDVPSRPFEVQAIGFFTASTPDPLPGGQLCEGQFPQEVQLYLERDAEPGCAPTIARAFGTDQVTAARGACPERPEDRFFVELRVAPAVRVEEGDRLFVAVQLSGNAERTQCVRICTEVAPEIARRSFVGSTAESLCPWTSLFDMVDLEQTALDVYVEGVSP